MAPWHGLWQTPARLARGASRSLAVRRLVKTVSGIDPYAMSKPIKHSVAVLIRRGDRVLVLRRPDDDDELPGIWGLPAGSFRHSETLGDLIERIGRDKLGVSLRPLRRLCEGGQDRPTYRLEMELWEVALIGEPGGATSENWKWDSVDLLKPGRDSGSLCCALALKSENRVSL